MDYIITFMNTLWMKVLKHVGEASYRNNIVANKEINFMRMYFKMIQDKTIKL